MIYRITSETDDKLQHVCDNALKELIGMFMFSIKPSLKKKATMFDTLMRSTRCL